MTELDLYNHVLTELNSVEAASLLLEDFNYFANKAVQQYINKVYNRYDINQQSSDDLRVLKATTILDVQKWNNSKYYFITLPDDYMHILNCIVQYKAQKQFGCYKEGEEIEFPARRLTADMAAGIMHNVYMKPDYKRPYYYINNINDVYYNPFMNYTPTTAETSAIKDPKREDPNSDKINPEHTKRTDTYKENASRLSNASKVRLELRTGSDSIFKPEKVSVDYIKSPMFIRLTYDDITRTEDRTRILEFPDYVCYEIINELVKLLMENSSDPRVQTNYAVNQTIANPLAQSGDQS